MNHAIQADLDALQTEFREALERARSASDDQELQRIRSSFFGPKGRMTSLLRGVGQLPADVRPAAGREANRIRQQLEGALSEALTEVESSRRKRELESALIDVTLDGRPNRPQGGLHPINRIVAELIEVFTRMGFDVAGGPEVELDWFNFSALNFPPEHPARDMQDTFFVRPPEGDKRDEKQILLRTHTSPVQIRAMTARGAPIRIIVPGRVYRCDSDATHSPMFHQIEGLWVDEGVSFAHLKGVLTAFVREMFGERPVRFRPSYFPFVEPGAEMDMQCTMCRGVGCRLCKGSGWMEVLGAGMVHPAVLESCDVDSERYTGFAFGLGIDRMAMVRWGIDDLAHLFRGDMRFLEQL